MEELLRIPVEWGHTSQVRQCVVAGKTAAPSSGPSAPLISNAKEVDEGVMKVRHIAIYKIHGVNRLITKSDSVVFLTLKLPTLSATLTSNPEQGFLHVDRSAALLNQLFTGIFAPDKKGALEERLAAAIEEAKARRRKQSGRVCSSFLRGKRMSPPPDSRLAGILTGSACLWTTSRKLRFGKEIPFRSRKRDDRLEFMSLG